MKNLLKQKGFLPVTVILVITLVIAILASGIYFYRQGGSFTNFITAGIPQIARTTDTVETVSVIPQIKNDADLEVISSDLENSDLDQLDSQLDQLSIE